MSSIDTHCKRASKRLHTSILTPSLRRIIFGEIACILMLARPMERLPGDNTDEKRAKVTMESQVESLKLPVSKNEILATTVLSSMMSVFCISAIPFGFFAAWTDSFWWALIMPLSAGAAWCILSRFMYLLLEIANNEIIIKHLFWTKRLLIEDIAYIKVVTYDYKPPLRWYTQESESVSLRFKNMLLRYIFFMRFPKKLGVGNYLIERVRTLNPAATVSIW